MQSSLFNAQPLILDLPGAELAYYPDFIAEHESCYQQLQETISWQQDQIQMYGRRIAIPRLNAWYGDEGMNYSYSGIALTARPWTPALMKIKQQLQDKLAIAFNSVLLNYYRDGNDSVSWHADDEPELGPQPLIASLSLGATRRFSLRHKSDRKLPVQHIDLEAGSLLVMAGDTQRNWHHQIAKTRRSIGGRINLTFRSIIS